MAATDLFPEDIVIAIFHLVGTETKLVDDERLATAFDEAAKASPIFARFRKHPWYNYSKLLSETLQTLDLGGSIVRDNAPLQNFRVSDHVVGEYGESKFARLGPKEAKIVKEVATKIQSLFSKG